MDDELLLMLRRVLAKGSPPDTEFGATSSPEAPYT